MYTNLESLVKKKNFPANSGVLKAIASFKKPWVGGGCLVLPLTITYY